MQKNIIVILIMFGLMVNSVICDTTYVSGIINTNTVWSNLGSPYIINDTVIINSDVRLDILPGVNVFFSQDKNLIIKGKLNAIGTIQDSITFTALDTNQRWQRLWFKPEAKPCSLKYCKISYAWGSAVYNEDTLYIGYSTIANNSAMYGGGILNFGLATITNNTLSQNIANLYGGGGISNEGKATIVNNIVSNNIGINGGGIFNYTGTAIITNNTLTNNIANQGIGGGILNFDTVTITNNTLINNNAYEGGGIYNYNKATIMNNTITSNFANTGGGIYNYSGNATIENNTINRNRAGLGAGIINSGSATITNNTITNNRLIHIEGAGITNFGTATITYNTIIDTTGSTIRQSGGTMTLNYNNLNNPTGAGYILYNNTPDTVNARYNYWFTLDTNIINLRIYDYWDNVNFGEVYYQPFLDAPLSALEQHCEPLSTDGLSLAIYPNPAKNVVYVRSPSSVKMIKLYDISGKLIKVQAFGSSKVQSLSLSGIQKGVYFIKAGNEISKLIVFE